MKKQLVMEIYDFLKARRIVDCEGEFSLDWLGQSESYLRGLRFKKTEPSVGVVAICGSRFRRLASRLCHRPAIAT